MANSNFRHLYANAIEGVLTNKNYIKNAFAAENANLWNLYADAASNIPVNGTGGTATGLTFAASASSPLEGDLSFLLTQANSTSLQGKGVSTDFTIDNAALASLFTIKFDYLASNTFVSSDGFTTPLNDGTTSTNAGNSDIEVFIYDITNAVLIPVNPSVLISRGNGYSFKGTFQTAANSNSYRLILHVATTSANATGWTFKFDNVFTGRLPVYTSSPGSDWTPYTMTPSGTGTTPTKGTIIAESAYWRRVGDSAEINYSFRNSTGGSTGSGDTVFMLPTGLFIDYNKASSAGGTSVAFVAGNGYGGGGANSDRGFTALLSTSFPNGFTLISDMAADNGAAFGASLFGYGSNNTSISFHVTVPILGWSSENDITVETDLRTVAAKYFTSANGTANSSSPFNFDTKVYDTHRAVTASAPGSGAWTFTAPMSGYYGLKMFINDSVVPGAGGNLNLFKNGVGYELFGYFSPTLLSISASTTIQLTAGDTIEVRTASTGYDWFGASLNGGCCLIEIEKLSGASSLVNSNTIAARASGTIIGGTAGGSPIIFPTVDFDTNAAYNNTTGQYQIPVSGFYEISGVSVASNAYSLSVYINGVLDSTVGYADPTSGSTAYAGLIKAKAGDLVTIVPNSATGAQGLTNFSILKKI